MPFSYLGIIIPTVNLLVMLGGGLYALAILKNSVASGLESLRVMHEELLDHSQRVSRLETRAADQQAEIERARKRLDDLIDKHPGRS